MDSSKVENGKLITPRGVWAHVAKWVTTQLHNETECAKKLGTEILTIPSLWRWSSVGMCQDCDKENRLQHGARGVSSVLPVSTRRRGYLAHSNPHTGGFQGSGKPRTSVDSHQDHPHK